MRALVSRLSSLGDVVCTLPAAAAIKGSWPESHVTWVVDRRFRGVLECCRNVDAVVERPERPWQARAWGPFEAALDLQGLFKSGVLVAFARAERKLGYHWQREGSWLFSQRVLPDPTSLHIVDQLVDVVRALGADVDRATFGLEPLTQDLAVVEQKLKDNGWSGGPFVLCNAGAGWSSKRWPAGRFAELSRRVEARGLQTVFLGAASDRGAFNEVVSCGAQPVDMVGKTSVRELIALVELCSAHVGGDTGSTHIAAALGKPAIGVYTLTRPERSCPYGQFQNCFVGNPEVDAVLDRVTGCLG